MVFRAKAVINFSSGPREAGAQDRPQRAALVSEPLSSATESSLRGEAHTEKERERDGRRERGKSKDRESGRERERERER